MRSSKYADERWTTGTLLQKPPHLGGSNWDTVPSLVQVQQGSFMKALGNRYPNMMELHVGGGCRNRVGKRTSVFFQKNTIGTLLKRIGWEESTLKHKTENAFSNISKFSNCPLFCSSSNFIELKTYPRVQRVAVDWELTIGDASRNVT